MRKMFGLFRLRRRRRGKMFTEEGKIFDWNAYFAGESDPWLFVPVAREHRIRPKVRVVNNNYYIVFQSLSRRENPAYK